MPRRPLALFVLALGFLALASAPAAARARSDALDWLERYVRLDTTNPPGSEILAARFLAATLAARGLASEVLVSPAGRANLVARLPATVPGAPDLVLLHHMDVVPAGGGWSALPFSGELRGGDVWGRGSVDDKSLGVAELAAFADAAKLPVRRRGLLLLAVADEEAGGEQGTIWLLAKHPELFAHVEAVLNEGGENRVVGERQLYWGVEVAQKRALWLRVVARGRAGHASGLNPESAAHQLIQGLARVLALKPQWKIPQAARRFFAAVAPLDRNIAALSARLDEEISADGPRHALLPGLPGYFLDTVQVTRLEASDDINVVAPEARAWIDARLLPETDETAFLAALRAALGPNLETEVLLASPRAPSSPSDSPFFHRLSRALEDQAPVVPDFIAGMTDSRDFRAAGIPAYGFSPFVLDGDSLRGIHAADEHIPAAAFERGVERMRRVVAALVTATDDAGPR